jgi:phosphate transport system substrate-binding protein
MTIGAVAVVYNLPGVKSLQLKLSGAVLANICLKKVNDWNDPSIAALNPGLTLPDKPIAVIHRSDGSGTTYIFTNYLSKISSEWQTRIGFGTAVSWPGDIGGEQSAGVVGQIQKQPYSIGYVELAYAMENNVSYAVLQNATGNFITPTIDSTNKAAEGMVLPDDMRVMITNSPNPEAYPIAGFTWILADVNQRDEAKGKTLVNVLWWAVHDGQQYNAQLEYGKLSAEAVKKVENEILSINYNGQPLLIRP